MSSRPIAGARMVAAWTLWSLLFVLPQTVAGQSSSAVDRIREADRSVVRVVTHVPGGYGTGSGSVVAAGHVVQILSARSQIGCGARRDGTSG